MSDNALLTSLTRAHIEEAKLAGEKVFSRRRVIAIADFVGVKPMQLVRRIEKLGLLRRGAYAWFKANGGITADHVSTARTDRRLGGVRS